MRVLWLLVGMTGITSRCSIITFYLFQIHASIRFEHGHMGDELQVNLQTHKD